MMCRYFRRDREDKDEHNECQDISEGELHKCGCSSGMREIQYPPIRFVGGVAASKKILPNPGTAK